MIENRHDIITASEYSALIRQASSIREAAKRKADKEFEVAVWQANERLTGVGSWGINNAFE